MDATTLHSQALGERDMLPSLAKIEQAALLEDTDLLLHARITLSHHKVHQYINVTITTNTSLTTTAMSYCFTVMHTVRHHCQAGQGPACESSK